MVSTTRVIFFFQAKSDVAVPARQVASVIQESGLLASCGSMMYYAFGVFYWILFICPVDEGESLFKMAKVSF